MNDNIKTDYENGNNATSAKEKNNESNSKIEKKKSNEEQIEESSQSSIYWVTTLSLIANIVLFIAKVVVFILTLSISVVASLIDSALDLVTQIVLYWTQRNIAKTSSKYPVGRTRLEPVSIVGISVLMVMASVMIIREALGELIAQTYTSKFNLGTILTMCSVVVIKFALWLYCRRFTYSPTAMALAEDHMNDVCSNIVAVVCGSIASYFRVVAWLDPVGGIGIAIYIIARWIVIGRTEMQKLVGREASEDMLNEIRIKCDEYHDKMDVDVCRAYHIGRNVLVEVEVIMPKTTTLVEAHDISLDLQKK